MVSVSWPAFWRRRRTSGSLRGRAARKPWARSRAPLRPLAARSERGARREVGLLHCWLAPIRARDLDAAVGAGERLLANQPLDLLRHLGVALQELTRVLASLTEAG